FSIPARPVSLSRVCAAGHRAWPVWRFPRRGGRAPASPKKTACGVCGFTFATFYDQRPRRVRDLSCGDKRVYLSFSVRRVWCLWCGGVKTERLPWIADNPFYTKRFAFFVGRRCRDSSLKAVAEEVDLDWQTVQALD